MGSIPTGAASARGPTHTDAVDAVEGAPAPPAAEAAAEIPVAADLPASRRAMSGGFAAAQLAASMTVAATAGPASPAGVPYSLAARPDVRSTDRIMTGGRMDTGAVLAHLSQRDDMPSTLNDADRCGTTALVASAIASGGKDGLLRLIDGIRPSLTSGDHVLGTGELAQLAQIRGRVADGSATHADLARLQEVIFLGYNGPDPAAGGRGAISDADMHDLYRLGGMTPPERGTSPDRMQPGQSWPLNIDLDGSGPHHWVVMGKDTSGRAFVYDPEATPGRPQIHYTGSPEYTAYLARAGAPGSSYAPTTPAMATDARRTLERARTAAGY